MTKPAFRERLSIAQRHSFRMLEFWWAEAIMSVIGATDWFTLERANSLISRDDYILDLYPYQFVQETRNKLGGQLFMSTGRPLVHPLLWPTPFNPRHTMDMRNYAIHDISKVSRGTMLPFGSDRTASYHVWKQDWEAMTVSTAFDYWCEDHPSACTWSVCPKGSVIIQSAAIELSQQGTICGELSHDGPDTRMGSNVGYEMSFMTVNPSRQQTRLIYKLSDFVNSFRFPGVTHAVCVVDRFHELVHWRSGVVLGGQYFTESKYFVKLGYYSSWRKVKRRGVPEPVPAQAVDWIVL